MKFMFIHLRLSLTFGVVLMSYFVRTDSGDGGANERSSYVRTGEGRPQ